MINKYSTSCAIFVVVIVYISALLTHQDSGFWMVTEAVLALYWTVYLIRFLMET